MCGRTACTLAPQDVCRACGYKTADGKWRQPKWQDPPGGQKYQTSYNMAPGSYLPVLLSRRHFEETQQGLEETKEADVKADCEDECEWIVQPMHWGLVPSWHKGSANSVAYSMTNARSEGILSKKSFKKPLEKGCRCVILVDGYFEWQRVADGTKQPYFIYFPYADPQTVDILNKESADPETVYTGRRLLTMAALFDIWKSKDGDAPLYSFSIITVESHKCISWMHDRMPAILDGEEEVRAWIDYGTVPLDKALKLIRPRSTIQWHAVSTIVNNSRNNTEECIKPVDLTKKEPTKDGSTSLMKSWLSKAKKTETAKAEEVDDKAKTDEDEPMCSPAKKLKSDT